MPTRNKSPRLAAAVLSSSGLFAILYAVWLATSGILHQPWSVIAVVGVKACIEIVASLYAFTFLFVAVAYLWPGEADPPAGPAPSPLPRAAVIYLCCGDLDVDALRSLASLRYDGELTLFVHDDAAGDEERAAVNAAVEAIRSEAAHPIHLLRRPVRQGGKPGAVNFVLERAAERCDWFLLCDNDSIAVDPDAITAALRHCGDRSVGIVQFRTVGVSRAEDSWINRRLAESIDAFDVFLRVWARFGWMPFIGHNALLRADAVREVGGFTPGVFADDIDLTVRLNAAGYVVRYAPEIRMGETHPASYAALRARTYKWAYGCMQVMRAHALRVVRTPRLTLAEKFGFFHFAGFYAGQVLVLGYLVLTFLVAPFVLTSSETALVPGVVVGAGILLGVFVPVLAYFARQGRLVRSLPTILLFGLVYGATDFVCVRGLWDCVRRRTRSWIPTNASTRDAGEAALLVEAFFGALLLLVPLVFYPQLLWAPSAYLFGGKFLFTPSLGRWYSTASRPPQPARHRLAGALIVAGGILFALLVVRSNATGADRAGSVAVRGKSLYVDGEPFVVKGIHYGPWRPGTGPGKQYPYPDRASIDADLTMIARLHANTILVFDPPDYVLDLAQAHGLRVMYTFAINWSALPLDDAARERILTRVRQVQSKPALLAWILGNEVPSRVLDGNGASLVAGQLADLYRRVKAIDPVHPVSHSNWVTAKELNLQFLDFESFNVYPLWPPQVVALGYDTYINRFLRPIAGNKPLVMTEFGVNTLEAGEPEQATIVERTWRALRRTDAAGGIVMEFADEWWKNYDNPRNPRDWWDREFAPDDELRHDNDPEEYYGLVTAERQPRPAFAAVARMFADDPPKSTRSVPAIIVIVLGQTSILAWFAGRRGHRNNRR